MTRETQPRTRTAGERPITPEEALARVGRALSHPLRIRILLVFADVEEASPVEVARKMHESLGNVSYHTRYLAEVGAIQPRRMVPRRGAVKHYYAIHPALRVALPLVRHIGAGVVPAGDASTEPCAAQ